MLNFLLQRLREEFFSRPDEFDRENGLDSKLAQMAQQNTDRTKVKAVVIVGDAGNFEFPDEPLTVLMNNPFGPEVMEKVAKKLSHHSHRVDILYTIPKCAESFSSFHLIYRDPAVLVCSNRHWL